LLVTTLQRSLLPPALPAVPGLDAAAHYHFASPDEVGGDFYDLFPLSGTGGACSSATCAARARRGRA
jgi:sigma-B regulation protein RsbU (phosphoserine phosphatase)